MFPDINRDFTVRLREAGLTREFIRQMTEPGDSLRSPLRPTRQALYSDDPAAVVLRLFFCGEAVAPADIPHAFRDVPLLVPDAQGRLQSPLHLRTVAHLYLFSDYLGDDPDGVMGAGETTAVLYRAANPPHPLGSVLDLGCGAGALALLLAAKAARVTGTDINPRAVALARLNAQANGIENAEFRCGDMYAPVHGEKFDWIVSQPPYYPEGVCGSGLTYLHGGPRGDELPTRVVEGIPRHLSPGGRAHVFTSWPANRRAIPLPGHDCLELFTNRRELSGTRQSLMVVRSGSGWSRSIEIAPDRWGSLSSERIDELFRVQQLLDGSDDELLRAPLRMHPGTRLSTEGGQALVLGGADSLVACAPVTSDMAAAIKAVRDAPAAAPLAAALAPALRDALGRGLLTVAKLESTTHLSS